jgi:hypothetical protein
LWNLAARCRGREEEALLGVVAQRGGGNGGGGGGVRARREEVAALARLGFPLAPRGAFAAGAAASPVAAVIAAAPSLPSTSQGGAPGGKCPLALENLESRVDPDSQEAQLAICQLNIASQQAEVKIIY